MRCGQRATTEAGYVDDDVVFEVPLNFLTPLSGIESVMFIKAVSFRSDFTRSSTEVPSRKRASNIVDSVSVQERRASTSVFRSSCFLVASRNFCFRSALLVIPSETSHEQMKSRSLQKRHVGLCPEHLVFLFRH